MRVLMLSRSFFGRWAVSIFLTIRALSGRPRAIARDDEGHAGPLQRRVRLRISSCVMMLPGDGNHRIHARLT